MRVLSHTMGQNAVSGSECLCKIFFTTVFAIRPLRKVPFIESKRIRGKKTGLCAKDS